MGILCFCSKSKKITSFEIACLFEAGRKIGIYTQMSEGRYGVYLAVLYDSNAQQFLLDHFWSIYPTK